MLLWTYKNIIHYSKKLSHHFRQTTHNRITWNHKSKNTMGRYKRKKNHHHHNNHGASWSSSLIQEVDNIFSASYEPGTIDFFSPVAQQQLKEYLIAYRDGCEYVCFGSSNNAAAVNTMAFVHDVVIGGQPFPPLTEEVLSRPYLSLPTSLSNKHRRDVHKLCVDVDLYHCGIGIPSSQERHVAISIHSDGLSRHPQLQNTTNGSSDGKTTMRHCKPWFYGNGGETSRTNGDITPTSSNSSISWFVEEATKNARADIQALIDQPEKCVRDAQDSINYPELENYDLSGIPPPTHDDNCWMLVDSAQGMKDCAQELIAAMPSVIAFDLEMWNVNKYTQVTCLIQLTSDAGKEYVIDTLAEGVWEHVALLAQLFSDPSIVKVGHSIGGLDVKSLHRDFGIFVLNAFDTYEAARVLHLKHTGLASVCRHYGLENSEVYTALKDEYQKTDWRQRPLTEPMIRYGRYDVHYLIAIRTLMMRDLTRKDLWDNVHAKLDSQIVAKALAATLLSIEREEGDIDSDNGDSRSMASAASDDAGYYTPEDSEMGNYAVRKSVASAKVLRMQPQLMKVITMSQRRCLDLWKNQEETHEKNPVLMDLIQQSFSEVDINYNATNLELLECMVSWRKRVSKMEQCLPALICSLDLLVNMSWKQPTSAADLRRIVYFLPVFLEDDEKNYQEELLGIVRNHVSRHGIAIPSKLGKSYDSRLENDNDDKQQSKRRRLVYSTLTVAVVGAALAGMVLSRRRQR